MKIKTVKKSYEEVMAIELPKHKPPRRPLFLLRCLINLISWGDLRKAKFKASGKLPHKKEGPCLVLMNHSSFIDMQIAHRVLFPRPFSIVCGYDAFVGKRLLMRLLGCIPTRKFISDLQLLKDMKYAIKKGRSVLMYPEAGYSLDGTATAIPKLGMLARMLGVPVVMIKTDGAFLRDPLYNELRLRRVPVSATITTIISKEEAKALDIDELTRRIDEAFTFDNFKWQRENNIEIDVPFLAEGIERTLYKCPSCGKEGSMRGDGVKIICDKCKKTYVMDKLGVIRAEEGVTEFTNMPDWFNWEREMVREEILNESYSIDVPVKIFVLNDCKALYEVGSGRLTHSPMGFRLTGCDGKLDFVHKALTSHTINVDYFWYEIGDTVCVGDNHNLYYCFPEKGVSVAKARLAAEELYKLHQDREFHLKHCSDCDHHVHTEKA